MNNSPSNILLTGPPGCGKTTAVTKLAKLLQNKNLAGFYTQEIRADNQRTGFSVQTFNGANALFASTYIHSGPRVGKYRVDIPAFEKIALPQLTQTPVNTDLIIIDEIGKMECFSPAFILAVTNILDCPTPLVATLARHGAGFIQKVKSRQDIVIIELTNTNRNTLPQIIADRLAIL